MCSIDFDCVSNNSYKNNIDMKAKEMPEKIYLFDYNDAMVTPIEGDTVYVMEDVFIEKACEFIEDKLMEYLPYQLADSLLADFREALKKGE